MHPLSPTASKCWPEQMGVCVVCAELKCSSQQRRKRSTTIMEVITTAGKKKTKKQKIQNNYLQQHFIFLFACPYDPNDFVEL